MSQITKKALEAALKELLLTKTLDKITIQDLTEACGISRSTFYYHFQDIYALVEWACTEDSAKALAGNKTYDTWENGFRDILHELLKDKAFIYNVYRYTDNRLTEEYLQKRTSQLLYDVVEENAAGMNVTEQQKRFIADFYQFGFVGLTVRWVDGGMKENPDRLVEELGVMLKGSFRRAIESFEIYNMGKADHRPHSDEEQDSDI